MKELAKIRDLTIAFESREGCQEVVKHLSFDIFEGEILGVVGESGSGKSMSALAMMGLLPSDAMILGGEIEFQERDLLRLSPEARRRVQGNEISMVFQEPMTSLNPVMTIGKQVGETLELHTGLPGARIREKVLEALELVGLLDAESLCNKYPHELSGGMRQRVMIAQAMIASPRLLIADEPTTALDVIVQAQILRLLKKIHREQKTSILFISHDLNVIKELCDRVIVVYKGEIAEQGSVNDVLYHPRHEYTRRLVASIPEARDSGGKENEILRLQDLNVYYDVRKGAFWKKKTKKHVIQNVSFSAFEGEILGIVGESGCGKSTLCKAILGLNHNYTGVIDMEPDLRPQMVFQDPFSSLNPARRIGWILEEPLKLRGIADRRARKRMVDEMLEKVGLEPSFARRRTRELSGGQRQRISIGTALLMESRLVIADEPVSALDVTIQSQILNLLLRVHEEQNMTLLFITHDLNIVRRICRRVLVIYLGEIVEMGSVDEIYRFPAHPYTRLLLDSILDGEQNTEESGTADMGQSSTRNLPGCPFYPRCPEKKEQCRSRRPDLKPIDGTHTVKCWNFWGEKEREKEKESRENVDRPNYGQQEDRRRIKDE